MTHPDLDTIENAFVTAYVAGVRDALRQRYVMGPELHRLAAEAWELFRLQHVMPHAASPSDPLNARTQGVEVGR